MKEYKDFNKQEFNKWISIKGSETLRLDYDLNENSLVVDAGGFKGEWSQRIFNKYKCNILIFEPVEKYYNILVNKFKNNNKVSVFKKGFSNEEKNINIYHSNDASSTFWGNGKPEVISLIKFSEFFEKKSIDKVDLFKINIEGGEYELMQDIIESDIKEKIYNFQIQYHRFIENCSEKRDEIRNKLKDTHEITYDFEFIWENWKLKT